MNCYFFGTFNPIHIGHIEIARQIKEKFGFQKIIFVPSYMPPHKIDGLATYSDRLEMVKLAVGKENVSDIEFKLKVPSYTYRTIEKIYSENGNLKVNFIIGYDQFFKIESWKEPDVLKEKIHFIVMPRRFENGQTLSDKAFEYLKVRGFDFEIINLSFLDISSSLIRKYIAQKQDITGLVSREVKEYIEVKGIYRKVAFGKPIH